MSDSKRTLNRLRAGSLGKVTKPGYHHDGGGLYLQVREGRSGLTRSWVFRYQIAGKPRAMGLGPLGLVSLAEARQKATEARKLLLARIDPIASRDPVPAASSVTFQAASEAYISAHDPAWSAVHANQWRNSLANYAYPVLGNLPVAAIDTRLVLRVLEPLWGTKTETASRVRNRIERVLDWATVREFRSGDNPARWKGRLEHILPPPRKVARVAHFRALPYAEMPAFMVALRAQPGAAARALEFAILCATRSKETHKARWSEISIADRLWTVPAERMKASREHRVPLSDTALAVLEAQGSGSSVTGSEFVFPSTKEGVRPLNHNAFYDLLQRMGRGDLTAHGFRSTFMDWATEQTGFPDEMRQLALAHTVSDKVEAAYRRGDMFERRREMMAAWAGWCSGSVAPAQNVIPLRATAARGPTPGPGFNLLLNITPP